MNEIEYVTVPKTKIEDDELYEHINIGDTACVFLINKFVPEQYRGYENRNKYGIFKND